MQLLTRLTEVACSQFLSVKNYKNGGLVEIMSVSEEDVKRWFETAQKWGSANSAIKCKDTFECLEELTSFLKDLESAFGEVVGNKILTDVYFLS